MTSKYKYTYSNVKIILILGILTCLMILGVYSIFIPNDGIYRFLTVCIFTYCILRGIQEPMFLNPYILFSLTPMSLMIYDASISPVYMQELTHSTWLLGIINMLAFIIGLNISPKYRNKKIKILSENSNTASYHSYILAVLGLMPVLFQLVGITMPLTSVLILFQSAALVFALKSKKFGPIIIVLAVFGISLLNVITKTTIFSFFIVFLISIETFYIKNRKSRIKFLMLVAGSILMVIAAFTISQSADAIASYYGNRVDWNYSNYLMLPYMYMTTPWTNLQYVVETQNIWTYGLWFLKPILGYLQIDSFFKQYYSMQAYSSFNTFTFIATSFKDFGYLGSCLSSAFLGFFVREVYTKAKISKSAYHLAGYSLVAVAVAEMFFSNHFYTQSFPFTIVISMWLYKKIFYKNNIPKGVNYDNK